MGYAKLPVCIAKTQYSLSDDSKNLQDQGKYKITIKDIDPNAFVSQSAVIGVFGEGFDRIKVK